MEKRVRKRDKRSVRRKKYLKRKRFFFCVASIVVITSAFFIYKSIDGQSKNELDKEKQEQLQKEEELLEEEKIDEVIKKEIIITAAGDCTLGTDTKFSKSTNFLEEVKKVGNDYSHFMKNVKHIFEEDDYTIVNLETTFTDSDKKENKGNGTVYHFKGPKEFVNILTSSSIDGVTVANNHIYDYGKEGFQDTINTLEENNVQFFGEGYKVLKEIKGVKFGFLGYQAWSDTKELRNKVANDIKDLKEQGAVVVIPYFHWGIEREYMPNDLQTSIAKFAIDSGADMILGSHPHVIQSIESYNGKLIVYSLGNFSFGGNSNPNDKNTIIVQAKFNLENEEIVNTEFKVIPTMISSMDSRNDYVPTPASGENRDNILNKLNKLSPTMNGSITDEYFIIE